MPKDIPNTHEIEGWQFARVENPLNKSFLSIKGIQNEQPVIKLTMQTIEQNVATKPTEMILTLADARRLCSVLQDEILTLQGLGNEFGASKAQ